MNPLGNGNVQNNQLPPQMRQNIQQVKGLMQAMNGNPAQLAQQNPMLNQVMQMCNGQNPQAVFMSMCKQRGIDPDAILKELRS